MCDQSGSGCPPDEYVLRQDLNASITGGSIRDSGDSGDKSPVAELPEPVLICSLLGTLPETQTGRLVLLSLELWSTGFSIRYAWYADEEGSVRSLANEGYSGCIWNVFDDLGQEYRFSGANSRLVELYLETGEWAFTPPLDSNAAAVTVEQVGSRGFRFVAIIPRPSTRSSDSTAPGS